VLGKVGAGITNLDELYEGNASGSITVITYVGCLTPVPLSTTRGAEGSMLSSDHFRLGTQPRPLTKLKITFTLSTNLKRALNFFLVYKPRI